MLLITKLMDEHNAVVQYAQESHHKDGFLDGMKKAIEIVKNHNGWISVDDKLLKQYANKDILIYTRIGDVKKASYSVDDSPFTDDNGKEYAYSHWFLDEFGDFMYEIDEVKYWQPIPKPPKEQ